jgi:hypothetical protein
MKFYASKQVAMRAKPKAKWIFSAPSKTSRITADLDVVAPGERIWFTSFKVLKQAEKYLEEIGHSPLSYQILYGNEINLRDPL